jgi:hypothetical protein
LGGRPFDCPPRPEDRYGLLTQALLSGQLDLSVRPDPRLVALADPYDPVANRPFRVPRVTQDASLFQGHLYYYFGAGPVLALFAPWLLFTGTYLREDAAVPILATLAAIVSWLFIRLLSGEGRLAVPLPLDLAMITLVSLSSFGPFLCRTPETYETAIAAGSLFALAGVYALAGAWVRPTLRARRLSMAAAGGAFGLAFASRPTHALDVVIMALFSAGLAARSPGDTGGRATALGIMKAVAPLWAPWAVIAMAVFAYNWARFGQPSEFGVTYVLSSWPVRGHRQLSAAFLPLNLYLYLLAPPTIRPEFPFVHLMPRGMPPRPAEYMTFEAIAGIVWCAPLLLMGLAWPALARARRDLALIGGALVVQASAFVVLLGTFRWAAARYILDFAPFLALAAALAWAALDERTRGRGWRRAAVNLVCGALLVEGVVVNGAGALTGKYSEIAGRAARVLEEAAAPLPRAWLGRRGAQYGAVEMDVAFPSPEPGTVETLLAAGDVYRRSIVCVEYVGRRRAAFSVVTRSGERVRSAPVRFDRDVRHHVEIEMGALLPVNLTAARRLWPGRPVEDWPRRLRIAFDGEEILSREIYLRPATPYFEVGRNWFTFDPCAATFTGTVVSLRRRLPEPVP